MPGTRAGRVGHGAAFGAVSILNATATGTGCALAVEAGASAQWAWQDGAGLTAVTPASDSRLVEAVWTLLQEREPEAAGLGATVRTASHAPPARGLKTSSSVAGALVRAALDALGRKPAWQEVADLAVAASRRARVTLTGAFDDQVAVLRGGAHLTDNAAMRVTRSWDVPAWHVALWVPEASIPKAQVAALDASSLAPLLDHLRDRLLVGPAARTLPDAMSANGKAFLDFYASHGLPVHGKPVQVAMQAGALGAGLSGTGPAVAAIFEAPVPLEAVPGGAWTWTRVAGLQA